MAGRVAVAGGRANQASRHRALAAWFSWQSRTRERSQELGQTEKRGQVWRWYRDLERGCSSAGRERASWGIVAKAWNHAASVFRAVQALVRVGVAVLLLLWHSPCLPAIPNARKKVTLKQSKIPSNRELVLSPLLQKTGQACACLC